MSYVCVCVCSLVVCVCYGFFVCNMLMSVVCFSHFGTRPFFFVCVVGWCMSLLVLLSVSFCSLCCVGRIVVVVSCVAFDVIAVFCCCLCCFGVELLLLFCILLLYLCLRVCCLLLILRRCVSVFLLFYKMFICGVMFLSFRDAPPFFTQKKKRSAAVFVVCLCWPFLNCRFVRYVVLLLFAVCF